MEIKEFLISRNELMAELDVLINEKASYLSLIRERVMTIYNLVNPLLKNGDLLLTDRAAVLICSIDIISISYDKAIEGTTQEEMMLGGMIEQGTETFSRLVEYNEGTPKFNHILPRFDTVMNWDHMPSSLEESIEYIYQGRRPMPVVPDNPKLLEATAALIDVARTQKGTFLWHFDIDIFDNNRVFVHSEKAKGALASYYPKQIRKR
jgi:hypothetical protein